MVVSMIVTMFGVVVVGRIGLFMQPAPYVEAFGAEVIEAGVEQSARIDPAVDRAQNGCCRIEAA
jgi:hypothetical protein